MAPPMVIRKQIVLPWTDLNLEGLTRADRLKLFDDIQVVLALLAAGRAGEPQLLDTDGAGALKVAASLTAPLIVRIEDGTTAALAQVGYQNGLAVDVNLDGSAIGDGIAYAPGRMAAPSGYVADTLLVMAKLYNGAAVDRPRSASAANLAAQSGLGVPLFAPPGEWNAQNNPAAGAAASAVQAAGGAGVRHIGRRISFGFSSQAALAGASTVTFNLRDGASGAGAIKEAWTFDLPAAIIVPFAQSFEVDVVGTAATAMTLEMAAAVAGLRGFVNLSGYDAS